MIKYLGSKRTLMPVLRDLIARSEAQTALDLFSGTTRIAREMKSQGLKVTAIDTASYSEVFGKTWIEIDGSQIDQIELLNAIKHLNSLSGIDGFFTENYCSKARFFQTKNGRRIDAIRNEIEKNFKASNLYYPLLTSLIMAADKVDSTTGVQMAYLKNWSPRSSKDLNLLDPELLAGSGTAIRADAKNIVSELEPVDLAYLDPPYNQHRYFGNYHIWETLVRWDYPEGYGVANKRVDARDSSNKSDFNSKLTMPASLSEVIEKLKAKTLILSYNNESWLSRRQLRDMCSKYEVVEIVDFDSKRYVGGQIGVYNHSGELVGKPGAQRNLEHLVLAGNSETVNRMVAGISS
ncbi:MAG: DNA adenine methylase [Actinomycetota bacterium]